VVGEHAYFPFGEEVTSPGQNAERMKFTGHERDLGGAGLEDDLDYMHARYCSPLAGRFLSVDPEMRRSSAGTSGQWNRYSYALNNPMGFTDPDGRNPLLLVGGLAIGGILFGPSAANAPEKVDTVLVEAETGPPLEFRANPTIRPGMEGLSEEAIKAQQAARIRHLETEIQTFRDNIQKIINEEL
jgi:RHS repeat-associated protein